MSTRALSASHRACVESSVIVVDDEPSFRLSLAESLRDDGHTVLDYPSPAAVPPFESFPDRVVLVTDFEMPGRNGLDLADAFRRARPTNAGILLSAYTIPIVEAAVATRPWLRFVAKPVDYDVLHALIHDLL